VEEKARAYGAGFFLSAILFSPWTPYVSSNARYDVKSMEVASQEKFKSPEEEIAFLREQIAARERELLSRNKEVDQSDRETVGKEVMQQYAEHDPSVVLDKKHIIDKESLAHSHQHVEIATHKVEEIVLLAQEKGIRNAMSVLEKIADPYLTDEVHRSFVNIVRSEHQLADLEKDKPLWRVLSMTLYEVALPRHKEDAKEESFKAIFSAMEQFFAGMQTISNGKEPYHYTLEISVSDKQDDIIFYVAVPNEFSNLFIKQAHSLFPFAEIILQQNDYNIFVEGGESVVTVLQQKKHPIYPIKSHTEFETDPLNVLLNAFSKIERDGGGAALQVVVAGDAHKYQQAYNGIIKRVQDGEKVDVAIRKSTLGGEFYEGLKDIFASSTKKEGVPEEPKTIDTDKIELFKHKIEAPTLSTNIRLVVSAQTKIRAEQILTEIESGFHQYENPSGNQFVSKRVSGVEKTQTLKRYSFREFNTARNMPLSIRELATMVHFPSAGIESSPQFKQSHAKYAPAPVNMPTHGIILGENEFRGTKRTIHMTPQDRVRHMYIIGQTGTGKTVFLKNMIIQDIQDGAGVCMIDPHGSDIVDVLSAIPPERLDDVIYFDPSNLDHTIGLNMLEFDASHPEQKTFVVNELFSMFKKLYGANPESMGPMFEQYFRNATLLVLEDPDSGSTLLDISRVMADAEYRNHKLSKTKNPVVSQFWEKIATKAGGEQSLENFVPYITSKIDPLTANDYMRPIIGQQRSSFNFRDVMDSKKILLVNLSKGRLGEINANLIGMIIVGKILMAALSRVDDQSKSFPPFYLYIDEFQNITTDSISSILSEARKYKLGLTVVHQFIAQLDETIRDAVFGNVGSMTVFRVGNEDAQFFEKQFDPVFSAKDISNIKNYNAYVKLLADGTPTPPFSMSTLPPHETNIEYAKQVMEYSALKYGRSRSEVDAEISARYLS